jgi:hypothetical protein
MIHACHVGFLSSVGNGDEGEDQRGEERETCDGRMVSKSVMARVICRRLPG